MKISTPWIIGIAAFILLIIIIGLAVSMSSKGGPRSNRLLAMKRYELRMAEYRYQHCRQGDVRHCDYLWRNVLRLRREVAILEKQASWFSYWWYPYYRGRWYNVSYPPFNPYSGWRWRRPYGRRHYERKVKSE